MKKHFETEIKVGVFVSIGVVLLMAAILMLLGAFFLGTTHPKTVFEQDHSITAAAAGPDGASSHCRKPAKAMQADTPAAASSVR